MEKYNGNQKGFIYVSCDSKDQEEVLAKYLEPLTKDGIYFWWAESFDGKEEKTLARAGAVMLFLTKKYVKGGKLRDTLAAAVKHNKPILCVYLEDVELDAALSMQTEAQQALSVSRYKNDDEFVKELRRAAIFDKSELSEQQKKQQKRQTFAAVAAAVIVLMAAIVIIRPLLSPKANAETMQALGLKGMSKEELESIEKLRIVGTEVTDHDVHAYYDDGDSSRIVYYEIDDGYFDGDKKTVQQGVISDLSGIEQLKNLKVLELEGQQIEDISSVLGMEKLESLSLNCNPVSSVEGLERLENLQWLDVSSTNITELPEDLRAGRIYADDADLRSIPDFGGKNDVWFAANRNEFEDYTKLSTAGSYDFLQIEAHNGKTGEIIGSLKGIPVRQFLVAGMQIDSLEDLADLDVSEELNIAWCSLTSLDGIEHFEGIEYLDLKYAVGLTDLSPVNKLKSLKKLTISDELAGLADQVDDRIEVEFKND